MLSKATSICASAQEQVDRSFQQKKLVSIGVAAKMLGVSIPTLRNWSRTGELPAIRCGHHRRYSVDELNNYIHGDQIEKKVVCYCRTSTSKQKEALQSQEKRVVAFAKEHFPEKQIEIVSEIGSGGNAERKGLKYLLELMIQGQIDTVISEYRDRFSRTHIELLLTVGSLCGVRFIFIESDSKSDKELLLEDLTNAIFIFSVKSYGGRHKTKGKTLGAESIEKGIELLDSGLSCREVAEKLTSLGFRHGDNSEINGSTVYRLIKANRKAFTNIPQIETTAERYIREKIRQAKTSTRVTLGDLYHSYRKWCVARNLHVLSRPRFTSTMLQKYNWDNYRTDRAIVGITVLGENITQQVIKSRKKLPHNELFDNFYGANRGKTLPIRELYNLYLLEATKSQSAPVSKPMLGRLLKRNGASCIRSGGFTIYTL